MRSQAIRRPQVTAPLKVPRRNDDICLEITDHALVERSATNFFQLRSARDPDAQAARLADQFLKANRALLHLLGVSIRQQYDGEDVRLVIQAGDTVGAIPLLSPTTARPGFGLVVQPRFAWVGLGPMLAVMGWRVSPTPLRLPSVPRSERRIPAWVLAFMILVRLKALLRSLHRSFELSTETLRSPKGTVHWPQYATRSLSKAGILVLPCTFPNLQEDRLFQGAVRYTLERQIQALESQKHHGAFVHRLLELAQQLLQQVRTIPSHMPSPRQLGSWMRRPLNSECFREGLQAMEWTIHERGLAGVSDLEGIPWAMSMSEFFEAWVETVFQTVTRRTGGQMKVGRRRETTFPICWDPAYTGSQKSLVPDLWIEWPSLTLIVDAKYKRHWEELQQHSWWNADEEFREQHRSDLLQVLAYANLAKTSEVIVCLAYPCSFDNWESLNEHGRLIHRADLAAGFRNVHIWLTAVPMTAEMDRVAEPFTDWIRKVLTDAPYQSVAQSGVSS